MTFNPWRLETLEIGIGDDRVKLGLEGVVLNQLLRGHLDAGCSKGRIRCWNHRVIGLLHLLVVVVHCKSCIYFAVSWLGVGFIYRLHVYCLYVSKLWVGMFENETEDWCDGRSKECFV